MFRIEKLLKLVFAVLILVTIFEIGYYIYVQNGLKSEQEKLTNLPTPTPIEIGSILPQPTTTDQALNPLTLALLRNVKKDVLNSSFLTNEYKGAISELDTQGGLYQGSGLTQGTIFSYGVKLSIVGKQKNSFTFYYTKKEVGKFKIVTIENGIEENIALSDLKVKDDILIKETVDLTKDAESNLVETKLIKL